MSTSPTQPASAANPSPVKEGDILASKYRVEKVLGVGGMGVVVAAEHMELSQRVALKFLLKQAALDTDLVTRFLREARASVRLKGAHVAKTLDVGRLENGSPYIVMEFLEGHDLHAELRAREGVIPVEDAVSYIVQAAEGLAEAHALGIVHRDLKPGNLFLTRGVDGRPLVKVLDFGISKSMDPIGGDNLSLTKTEMLLGSPLYMSPEQMRSSKHVDERSDLWALGAIAFELLTGRVPFEAESILELCFKVAQERAPSPKELRSVLPDELCAAVCKCLEKDPDHRFPNVGELARAFEPFALQRDRGTAERALDVLSTGKRPPMRSLPAIAMEAAPPTPPAAIAPAVEGGAEVPAAPVHAVTQSSEKHAEPVAAAAWGTTQAQPLKPSRKKWPIALAAGGVVMCAFAGNWLANRKPPDTGAALVPSVAASAHPSPVPESSTVAPPTTTAAAVASASAAPQVVDAPDAAVPARAAPIAKPLRPVASAPSAKPLKPAASAPASTPPPTDPAGFIKVRE